MARPPLVAAPAVVDGVAAVVGEGVALDVGPSLVHGQLLAVREALFGRPPPHPLGPGAWAPPLALAEHPTDDLPEDRVADHEQGTGGYRAVEVDLLLQ